MKQHQEFEHQGWEVLVCRVGIGGEYQATASRGGCNIHTRRFGGRGAKARAREAIICAIEGRRAEAEAGDASRFQPPATCREPCIRDGQWRLSKGECGCYSDWLQERAETTGGAG